MLHIAILEPEKALAESLMTWLHEAGYRHTCCSDHQEMIACLEQQSCDLLLFDCRSGDEQCEALLTSVRASQSSQLPLLYIGQPGAEAAVVRAIELGADDYMVRPFSREELLARIRVLAHRRAQLRDGGEAGDAPVGGQVPPSLPVERFGPFEVSHSQRQIFRDGALLNLTDKDFSLAAYLFSHPNELLSRHRLLSEVWGVNQQVNTRTVDMHISRLRKALALAGTGYEIKTVHQHGYCLQLEGASMPPAQGEPTAS